MKVSSQTGCQGCQAGSSQALAHWPSGLPHAACQWVLTRGRGGGEGCKGAKWGPFGLFSLGILVLADVSNISYFLLLGEGGRGSPKPPGGGGWNFYWKSQKGGGSPGGDEGSGGCLRRIEDFLGGRANFFFGGPKCPPRNFHIYKISGLIFLVCTKLVLSSFHASCFKDCNVIGIHSINWASELLWSEILRWPKGHV